MSSTQQQQQQPQEQQQPRAGTASDSILSSTNDDAAVSRLSAVNAGYLTDPFARLFVQRAKRRSPLINRGTYCRINAIHRLVRTFLDSVQDQCQIVSLGAGSDTLYFRLKADERSHQQQQQQQQQQQHRSDFKMFEVDLLNVVAAKKRIIEQNALMNDLVGENKAPASPSDQIQLNTASYSLISGDLRQFEQSVAPSLTSCGFDAQRPTMVIAECVLVYLQPESSNAVINWFGQAFNSATNSCSAFAVYDPMHLGDRFGDVMERNLTEVGILMPGFRAFSNKAAQRERFINSSWSSTAGANASVSTLDVSEYHQRCISNSEMGRLARLEMLDELEEYSMLVSHYCLTWAVTPLHHEESSKQAQVHHQLAKALDNLLQH
ncbi:leucine carboxyl methyltransferase [Ramicandelaber brevisporus]|nr:leucine carboxyl methyltransferase [Ramicandelaber brevisporus]